MNVEYFKGVNCVRVLAYIQQKTKPTDMVTSLFPRSLPRKLQWSPILASLSRTSWAMMFSTTPPYAKQPVLAIRREESSVWERRAPLNPHQVQNVIQSGVKVSVMCVLSHRLELPTSSLMSSPIPDLRSQLHEKFFSIWSHGECKIKSRSGLGQAEHPQGLGKGQPSSLEFNFFAHSSSH